MIEGGYILQPRCIDKSWIAHSAPVVRETWFFLLRKANHKDIKYDGFIVKRGQLFITYRGIRDALAWKIGYRTKRYSESAMKHTMKLLRRHLMVELTSEPRGNLITICNYDEYQSPENYERTGEQTDEQTNDRPTANQSCPSINNNDKNDKNEKKEKNNKKKIDSMKFRPDWIPIDLWQELIANRKFKKLQNTKLALTTFINSLEEGTKAGYTIEKCKIGRAHV